MDLEEYIRSNGIKKQYFAKQLGVTPQALSRIMSGRGAPRQKTAQKIVELTNGEVTFEDLFKKKENK